ncbi:MAG: hypothetical protein R3C61_20705 [Bacteroidia bacterium]
MASHLAVYAARYSDGRSATGVERYSGILYRLSIRRKARITTDQPWLSDVWKTGWRTARLCAGETYYDCPYYEQLQYVGDTRIQALISLYVAGDDRLMRRAINDFEESRLWNGLTQSRYPCQKLQLIPTYSLFWVSMIHDYWMHRPDTAYIHSLLPGTRAVLGWYETQMNSQNLLKKPSGGILWTGPTNGETTQMRELGNPAQDAEGNSSILSLQYAYTLRQAEELHRAFGENYYADRYKKQREQIVRAVYQRCWNSRKACFRMFPGRIFIRSTPICSPFSPMPWQNRSSQNLCSGYLKTKA